MSLVVLVSVLWLFCFVLWALPLLFRVREEGTGVLRSLMQGWVKGGVLSGLFIYLSISSGGRVPSIYSPPSPSGRAVYLSISEFLIG